MVSIPAGVGIGGLDGRGDGHGRRCPPSTAATVISIPQAPPVPPRPFVRALTEKGAADTGTSRLPPCSAVISPSAPGCLTTTDSDGRRRRKHGPRWAIFRADQTPRRCVRGMTCPAMAQGATVFVSGEGHRHDALVDDVLGGFGGPLSRHLTSSLAPLRHSSSPARFHPAHATGSHGYDSAARAVQN